MQEDLYIVEEILEKKINKKGNVMYKIKWKNYGYDECTWEPLEHLDALHKEIKEFQRQLDQVKKHDTMRKKPVYRDKTSRSKKKIDVTIGTEPLTTIEVMKEIVRNDTISYLMTGMRMEKASIANCEQIANYWWKNMKSLE